MTSISAKAQILTVGNELLRGTVLNTNAQFLGRELTDIGFEVIAQTSCGDANETIQEQLDSALSQTDLLIVTGGLGPTPDDVTRDAIAEYFKTPLILSKRQFDFIKGHYRRRKEKMPAIVRREALFPENAIPLFNRHGIALGFYILSEGKLIVVLPGVPSELEKMFIELVRPLLKKHFKNAAKKPRLIVKTVGLSEPEIMVRLGKDFFDLPFDFGIYPHPCEVTIRIYATSETIIRKLKSKVQKTIGESVYAYEEILLSEAVGRILAKKKRTVAVAESCTGGLLGAEFARIAGSSRYFLGGVIAYQNEIKEKFLNVSTQVLRNKGAVSEDVALALAAQIREQMKTDYALSITGIAGPDGGSEKKPVGLVYIALAANNKRIVKKANFWGDRNQIQIKSVKKAMELLWRQIR